MDGCLRVDTHYIGATEAVKTGDTNNNCSVCCKSVANDALLYYCPTGCHCHLKIFSGLE